MTPPLEMTPERFASHIWRPGKTDMMKALRETNIAPYQLRLIEAIKQTGSGVLGIAQDIAERSDRKNQGKDFVFSDILGDFPHLATAHTHNVISPVDMIMGLSKVHFSGDTPGFVDITCLFPGSVTVDEETQTNMDVPYGNRIPIKQMDLYPITLSPDESRQHVQADSSAWNTIASYLRIARPPDERAFSYQEFMHLADRYSTSPLIPFSFHEQAFDFWIKEPRILTHDGQELRGKILIQAVAVLQGASGPPQNFPPRTIVGFDMSRQWSHESKEVCDQMWEGLSSSIIRGYKKQRSSLSIPISAGAMNGQ